MNVSPFLFSVRIPTLLAIYWRKHLARNPIRSNGAAAPGSIIVFRLDQLGDLVLTTPLFRELKRMFPNSRCTVVVQRRYRAILTTNRHVDEILSPDELKQKWLPQGVKRLASAMWFFWTRLRHRQFDLAISPRWDVDEDLATMLCALANAGTRVGHSEHVAEAKRRINRGFDAAFNVLAPPGPLCHEVDRNLAIAKALGASLVDRRLDINLTENDRQFATELLTHHDRRRILVAIGIGGRAASRRWPLDRYAECIARLNQQRPVQPVVVCSSEEDTEASALSVILPVPPYILSGVPLRATCAVLQQCDLFLGNDSGTAHLAAAMDCPTVVVSRHPCGGDPNHANSPARFAPLCSRYRILQPLRGAESCEFSCQSTQPHCIKLVTVDMVAAAAFDLLHQVHRIPSMHGLAMLSNLKPGPRFANEVSAVKATGVP
jgi:ADP-heptose:LPS heptosyltransferase